MLSEEEAFILRSRREVGFYPWKDAAIKVVIAEAAYKSWGEECQSKFGQGFKLDRGLWRYPVYSGLDVSHGCS